MNEEIPMEEDNGYSLQEQHLHQQWEAAQAELQQLIKDGKRQTERFDKLFKTLNTSKPFNSHTNRRTTCVSVK